MRRGKLNVVDSLWGIVLAFLILDCSVVAISYVPDAPVLPFYPRTMWWLSLLVLAVVLFVLDRVSKTIQTRMVYYVILKAAQKPKELKALATVFSQHKELTFAEANMAVRSYLYTLRKAQLIYVNADDKYVVTINGLGKLHQLAQEFE